MFTSKINTLTGHTEWEVQNEDYDYQQELARAGFADMLHDYERVNLKKKYYFSLKISKNIKNRTKNITMDFEK